MVKIISKRQKMFRRYLGYLLTIITFGLAYWFNGAWFFAPDQYETLANFAKELDSYHNLFGLEPKLVPNMRFHKKWLSCYTMVTANHKQYICYYDRKQTLTFYSDINAPLPEFSVQMCVLKGIYPTMLMFSIQKWMLENETIFRIAQEDNRK